MNMTFLNSKYTQAAFFFMALMPTVVLAQNIKKDVEVVKPYQPVVSDANKMNELPEIADSMVIKPTFQYNITPTPISTQYQVQPINAAKMVSMPVQKLYKSYLKLGLGNYNTPLGELYINSLRSKSGTLGVYLKHQSSDGTIKLDNGKKVNAGYGDTKAELFGKKFYNNGFVRANAYFSGDKVNYYGYRTDDPSLQNYIANKDSVRQYYSLLGFSVGVGSTTTDSSKLSYLSNLSYNYFSDRFGRAEHQFLVEGTFSKMIGNKFFGLNTKLNYLGHNSKLDTTGYSNTLFELAPWMSLNTDQYKLRVGVSLDFASQNDLLKVKLTPQADFQFVVYEDVIIPFVGITGGIIQHSYRDVVAENPYVRSDLLVQNTRDKLVMYGGVKGSLGQKASYILKLNFQSTQKQYFFINDTNTILQNKFVPVYCDADLLNGYGEINYAVNEELSLTTRYNFYQYNLTTETQAWHKPKFDLAFEGQYNLRNKIVLNLGVMAIGKRYALQNNNVEKELGMALDFNMGAEYRYSKVLAFWLKFNNFTASKYQLWNQYPSQRFQLMGGFTYSL